jgi:hypothetical protein
MAHRYTKYGVSLSKGQQRSLKNAIRKKEPITLKLKHAQLSGNDQLLLTSRQLGKLKKHKQLSKGLQLKLSKAQLSAMDRIGGFLPVIKSVLGGCNGDQNCSCQSKKKGLGIMTF